MCSKQINGIAHFTDWIVSHVHVGALGWNGFLTFAILYWLIPRIYQTTLYSKKAASFHFWIGTLGILFYAIPMYWAGFTQGLMWREFTPEGMLKYPNFLETTLAVIPMHVLRAVGGALYLTGVIVMTWNLYKTMAQGKLLADEPAESLPLTPAFVPHGSDRSWHRRLERRPMQFLVISLIVILVGGMVEMMPTFMVSSNVPTIASVKPYSPLELQGSRRHGSWIKHMIEMPCIGILSSNTMQVWTCSLRPPQERMIVHILPRFTVFTISFCF